MIFRTWFARCAALLAAGAAMTGAAFAPIAARADASARSEHLEVRLVGDGDAIVPGKPFLLALAFKVRDGWHIYWRNPGDAGVATGVRWTLPSGFVAGDLMWPAPRRIVEHGTASYGYGGTSWLLTRIHAPTDAALGDIVRIEADVEWLACEAICVPGDAKLSLSLPVAAERRLVAGEEFGHARAAVPAAAPWPARFAIAADRLTLDVARPPTPGAKLRVVEFFPDSSEVLDHAAPQALMRAAGGFTLSMARGSVAKVPAVLAGVLAIEEEGPQGSTRKHYEIRAPGPGGD